MEGITFGATFSFPSPWPQAVDEELVSKAHTENGFTYNIRVTIDTHRRFIAKYDDGVNSLEIPFQPFELVVPTDISEEEQRLISAKAHLIFTWNFTNVDSPPPSIQFYCNGIEVKPEELAEGASFFVHTFAKRQIIEPLYASLDISNVRAPRAEKLFLRRIKELDTLLLSSDYDDMLDASLPLRQLLWEGGNSLALQVLRNHRMKLKFPWGGQELKLSAFEGSMAVYLEGNNISVRDLILTYAHVKGGVHLGNPISTEEILIEKYDEISSVQGKNPSLKAMQVAGRAVIYGLKPLVEAVVQANT